MIEYKSFIGQVEYDDQAKIFHGDVINTRTVITFEGKTVDEIERAFHESVDSYIDWCKEDGIEPEKPYSGKFIVRINPDLHRQIVIESKKRKVSLNKFVEEALIHEVRV